MKEDLKGLADLRNEVNNFTINKVANNDLQYLLPNEKEVYFKILQTAISIRWCLEYVSLECNIDNKDICALDNYKFCFLNGHGQYCLDKDAVLYYFGLYIKQEINNQDVNCICHNIKTNKIKIYESNN